tara:strand:- start:972 stop:3587 length:2616 start_codon:yes stop_codon:yes gene_type:complete
MIIKHEKKIKKEKINAHKFLLIYFIVTFFVGLFSFTVVLNTVSYKIFKNFLLDKIARSGRYEYIYLPKIIYLGLKSNFNKLEKINLDIKFEDIIILEKIRKNSLQRGGLPPRDLLPKIKVDVTYNKKKYSGEARLKGDRIAHYQSKDKTSYKIEIKKNDYLFGIKKFALQKPIIRNYVHEWIFHELAEDFGLIKLTYKFINLSINGEDKGLFVLEEGFGKELIERNKRRNGPIFGLDEDLNVSNIDPVFEIYNKKFWGKLENKSIALSASQKLRDFFDNKIKAEDVFDLEKWASFFAIIDLTGTRHGALLKSVKFYYNPINGLFEPVPFDGHRFKPNFYKFNQRYENKLLIDFLFNTSKIEEEQGLGWLRKIFFDGKRLNQDFYNIYIEKLSEISSAKFIKDFISSNELQINRINSKIYADDFWFHNGASGMGLYYFSLEDFMYQAQNIIDKLKKDNRLQVLKKNKTTFIIKNHTHNYDLNMVKNIICNRGDKKIKIPLNTILNNFYDTSINVLETLDKNLTCGHVEFYKMFNQNLTLKKIDYLNSNYNYEKFKTTESLKYEKYFYKENKKLFLITDEVIIDKNLYIPKNLIVVIKPNQKIVLINNAFIISNSPWIIGSSKGEVSISGKNDNHGGGILITDVDETTIVQNTKFSYLKGLNENTEFLVYGAINFNATKVKIINTKFENIYSEDALNIINSAFQINQNDYKNISSDAIDIDFSNGQINLSNFENIKNDAIDFSGSNASISNINFKNVSDKAISVGENSNISILKINAQNAFAGIVSKDGSKVVSTNITFNEVAIPFAAYQKKREYDHGSLIVKNYDIKNFHTLWLKDKKSDITANNKKLMITSKKILSIINNKKLQLIGANGS